MGAARRRAVTAANLVIPLNTLATTLLLGVALQPATAAAQTATPAAVEKAEPATSPVDAEEIVVTARKREETLLSVPVAVSVVSGTTLGQTGSVSLAKISQLIPQVRFEQVAIGGNGAVFNIRGVGSSPGDRGIEQTVAVNVDGVQSSRGKIGILSFFDVRQVEVLKGPQALFFGKNSPGGVISVKSNDPTNTFEGYVKGGYEFNARERYVEGAVGGPVSDTLGVRLAVRASKIRGWIGNDAVAGPNPFDPANPLVAGPEHSPGRRDVLGRLTVAWRPSSDFSANFKLLLADVHTNGTGAWEVTCAPGIAHPSTYGVPDPNADCGLNGRRSNGATPAGIANTIPGYGDGSPYTSTKAAMSSLALSYTGGKVNVTSITGYYWYDDKNFDNYDYTNYAQLSAYNPESVKNFSEELRIATDFDSPVNFTVGSFLESQTRRSEGNAFFFDAGPDLTPGPYSGTYATFLRSDRAHSTTYSVFGQVAWSITPQLELTGGARYTREDKSQTTVNYYVSPAFSLAARPAGVPLINERTDNNVSPEATLSWHPRANTTLYAAYKTGYKSGGLSTNSVLSAAATPQNSQFDPEKAKGGEIGAKGQFLNNRLTVNSSIYSYTFSDLQVSTFDSATTSFIIQNAAKLRTTGAELDLIFRPSTALRLHGALAYNHARYVAFPDAPCYAGQGCLTQTLKGAPPPLAADWSGIAGFTYDQPVGGNLHLGFSGDATYTSGYYLDSTNIPLARQDGFWRVDAGVRIADAGNRYELALIGRNLTNKRYGVFAADKPGGPATGGEYNIAVGRPRELALQLSARF